MKRGQADIKYHAALMDAYAEHLNVVEMMLIAAAEQRRSEAAANLSAETEEQKRSAEAAANLSGETGMATGARPGESLKRKHA